MPLTSVIPSTLTTFLFPLIMTSVISDIKKSHNFCLLNLETDQLQQQHISIMNSESQTLFNPASN